ncbi:hypothetical protein HED60_14920 [Planctomycetales bacterium ZRK34]|nr:hypothetical protein HED60_14920 [Planctomycetales bacterium ZRK34]
MKMLPRNYRLVVLNETGQTLDLSSNSANEKITVTLRPWKIASGVLYYGDEISSAGSTNLVDGGHEVLGAIDNSVNLYMGASGVLKVETDNASAAGVVSLYIEHSTDGGNTWPSGLTDFNPELHADFVAQVQITSTLDDVEQVFEI